jgi:hypothetical protein
MLVLLLVLVGDWGMALYSEASRCCEREFSSYLPACLLCLRSIGLQNQRLVDMYDGPLSIRACCSTMQGAPLSVPAVRFAAAALGTTR